MEEVQEETVRDAYGFEVKKELLELYQQYEPILLREERERTERWNSFLLAFADAHEDQFADRGNSARSLTALVESLDSVLHTDEKLLSHEDVQFRKQLQALVQAGIPTEIRGQLWQLFLKLKGKRKPGLYPKLVKSGLETVSKCRCKQTDTSAAANTRFKGEFAGMADGEPDFVDTLINAPFETVSSGDLSRYTDSTAVFSHILDSFDSAPSSADSRRLDNQENGFGSEGKGSAGSDDDEPIVRHCSICYGRNGENSARLDLLDWVSQIDKDLHRTFPGHLLMDHKGKAALKNVLVAYSRYNPYVGYCQGMNFIAGVLLLFMDEEDAFWCLAAIVEDVLPGYFSLAMVAPQVDQAVLKELVAHYFPSMAALFAELGVDVSSISMSWFLCIFVNSLPLESSLRVWDIMFFDGHPLILFRVALALLDIYSKALLATEDGMECLELMAQIASVSFDGSRLIDVACIAYSSVLFDEVEALRDSCRSEVFVNSKVPTLEGFSYELSLTGARNHEHVIGSDQAAQQLFGCEAHNINNDCKSKQDTASTSDVEEEAPVEEASVSGASSAVGDGTTERMAAAAAAAERSTSGRAAQPLKIGRNEILGKLRNSIKMSNTGASPNVSSTSPSDAFWRGSGSLGTLRTPSGIAFERANRPKPSMAPSLDSHSSRASHVPRGPTADGLTSLFSGTSTSSTHGDDSEDGDPWQAGNGRKAPSRARIAAYEIASNPAIRQVAIAQSFLRAEKLAQSELDGDDAMEAVPEGGEELEPDALRVSSRTSVRRSSRSRRTNRSDSGFFVSMSALSMNSVGGQSIGGGGSGASDASGPSNATHILSSVLEGLKAEVKCAQERRKAAEERSGVLQQTSSLLTVKINRLLQELEEKKQTVEDLSSKVDRVKGELRDLEEKLRTKDTQIMAVKIDQEKKQAELKEKDVLIANLQKKVKRFQRCSSSHSVVTALQK